MEGSLCEVGTLPPHNSDIPHALVASYTTTTNNNSPEKPDDKDH